MMLNPWPAEPAAIERELARRNVLMALELGTLDFEAARRITRARERAEDRTDPEPSR